jgi:hypothetical protein
MDRLGLSEPLGKPELPRELGLLGKFELWLEPEPLGKPEPPGELEFLGKPEPLGEFESLREPRSPSGHPGLVVVRGQQQQRAKWPLGQTLQP